VEPSLESSIGQNLASCYKLPLDVLENLDWGNYAMVHWQALGSLGNLIFKVLSPPIIEKTSVTDVLHQ